MLLKDLQTAGETSLAALYPRPEARSIVLMLCRALYGTAGYTAIVEPGYEIPDTAAFDSAMERLLRGEPIQYVLGECEFYGRTFKVTPDVLIPRPETELLCKEAIEVAGRLMRMRAAYGKSALRVRVLDLCTGSGCIAWTIALSVPGVEVTATDISRAALAVAAGQNFKAALKESGALAPVFVEDDLLSEGESLSGPFDMILSNPPYVKESEKSSMRFNVLDWEPSSALFVPDDDPLIFYRAIASRAGVLLGPDGGGVVEINETLADPTAALFRDAGFTGVEIRRDLAEKPRFVTFRKSNC